MKMRNTRAKCILCEIFMRVRLIGEGACLLAVDYTLHLIFISHIAIVKLVVINFHLWLIFVLSLINSALCVIECNFKLF